MTKGRPLEPPQSLCTRTEDSTRSGGSSTASWEWGDSNGSSSSSSNSSSSRDEGENEEGRPLLPRKVHSRCVRHGKEQERHEAGDISKAPLRAPLAGDRSPGKGVGGEGEDPPRPPQPQAATTLYSLKSLAIGASYFSVGVAMNLMATPAAYYLVESLDASSAETAVYTALVALPWSFKVFYGFLSDCVPLGGYRRKPYLIIGWMVFVFSNLVAALLGTPSVAATISLSFIGACGYTLSDVMTDAVVVERTKLEPIAMRGNLQASGYILRGCGLTLGSIGGCILYNKDTWGWGCTIRQLFLLNALVPVVMVFPLVSYLAETKQPPHQHHKNQARQMLQLRSQEIWGLVQLRSVWQPMAFVYVYNAFMIPNVAWDNFIILWVGLNDFQIGLIAVVGSCAGWGGLVAYKHFLSNKNWRSIYIYTTSILCTFSLLQLALIEGWNTSLGLPDLMFAAGDDAALEFVLAIQFLPITRMYAIMCPDGAEGASYAVLTTLSNVAYSVAFAIGEGLTSVFDVSNSSLSAGHLSGMVKLTIFTSLVQVLPLALIGLLPKNHVEQAQMQQSSASSRVGGAIFLVVCVGSIIFSLCDSLYYIFAAI